MKQAEFLALMPFISSDLVAMIMEKQNVTNLEAIRKLYASKLYAALENEKTKVWQYSTPMLYYLFEQEEKTGIIEYPDV